MAELPDVLVWAVLIIVAIQGLSMALLVYLMYQRRKDEKRRLELAPEEQPAKDSK